MSATLPCQRFHLISAPVNRVSAFAQDVRRGLTAQPKFLSCCYFYDREGSLLFEEICELPEYYLTRSEREILEEHAGEITCRFPEGAMLIELGSGNSAKTRILIEAFLKRQQHLRYMPIDICRVMLEDSSRKLLQDYERLDVVAVAAEYHEALRLYPAALANDNEHLPKLILSLGSNIGNLDRAEAAEFLRGIRETMSANDRLLVGIDLRKPKDILEPAYDDAQGVTAEFNLNLLARINRELGGHFDLQAFHHQATYDEDLGRIDMYLRSEKEQTVRIDNLELEIALAAGEMIHTENSYKYSLPEIAVLAAQANLKMAGQWFDAPCWFSSNLLLPIS